MDGRATSTPGRGRRPLAVAARWAVLLVALGGLLAMHGLSDHGIAAPTAAPQSMVAMHADGHGTDDSGDPAGGGGGHHELAAGMCLAIVAGLLLLVLVLPYVGRGMALWRRSVPDLAIAAAIRARARGPSPPDLTLLSIQRC